MLTVSLRYEICHKSSTINTKTVRTLTTSYCDVCHVSILHTQKSCSTYIEQYLVICILYKITVFINHFHKNMSQGIGTYLQGIRSLCCLHFIGTAIICHTRKSSWCILYIPITYSCCSISCRFTSYVISIKYELQGLSVGVTHDTNLLFVFVIPSIVGVR